MRLTCKRELASNLLFFFADCLPNAFVRLKRVFDEPPRLYILRHGWRRIFFHFSIFDTYENLYSIYFTYLSN